jgi:hypothetical protein
MLVVNGPVPVEESVAAMVTLKVPPPSVGVPLSRPVEDSVRPAGSAPVVTRKFV